MTEATTTIKYHAGIHARPASQLVQTASKFKSKIQLKAKGKTVDAKSILMIMSMGLVKGTEITFCADGSDEAEAVSTLIKLIDRLAEIDPPKHNFDVVDEDTTVIERKVSEAYVREQAKKFNRPIKRG